MKTIVLILCLSLFACRSIAKQSNPPCANLANLVAERFPTASVKISSKTEVGCKAMLGLKDSSLEYSEDASGKLFKNLVLYEQVFKQSNMDVKREQLTMVRRSDGLRLETVKLTIIPKRDKGRVKTINYFQKHRSLSFGQSAAKDMGEVSEWLLTR